MSALALAENSIMSLSEMEQNKGPAVVRTLWILLSISTIVVVARLYVKCRALRRIYWDDFFIIFAWMFGLTHAIISTMACNKGVGQRIMAVELNGNLPDALRLGFYSLAWGFLSPMAGRVSFCFFMLWVSGTDRRVKRWPFHLAIAIQLVVNIISVIVAYAQCGSHISLIWDPTKHAEEVRTCWAPQIQSQYGYFSGSVNTVTDVFLTVMPAIIIKHSAPSRKQGLTLATFLCLGFLAMIASIVKTYEARALSEVVDYTYDLVMYVIWISIELNVVMIISSIPIIRPLLSRQGLSRVIRVIRFMLNRPDQIPQPSPSVAKDDRGTNATWHDAISLDRSANRTNKLASSIASEEELVTRSRAGDKEMAAGGRDAIVVTTEIVVTSSGDATAQAHAALVGLYF